MRIWAWMSSPTCGSLVKSMAVTHPPAGLWSDLRCRCAESPIDPSDAWERRGQMRFTSSSRAMSDGASRHPRPECTVTGTLRIWRSRRWPFPQAGVQFEDLLIVVTVAATVLGMFPVVVLQPVVDGAGRRDEHSTVIAGGV